MNKAILKKAGLFSIVASGVCLVISIIGALVLYLIDYPLQAMMPRPLSAALYGVFVYGAVACICFMFSDMNPPRGGKWGKILNATISDFLKLGNTIKQPKTEL